MTAPQGWRYRKGEAEHGPVGFAALQKMARDGGLADEDLVYSPTVGRWVKAWEVSGLFDLAAAAAAPSPEEVAAARRRRILVIVIGVDAVVTAIVGIVLLLTLK